MYSADDQELLSTLTNQLTIALDNALAYKEIEQLNRGLEEKVRQRTEELWQEQEKLKEANQQLELRNASFVRPLAVICQTRLSQACWNHPKDSIWEGKSARPRC
ncbi:MAG TPA: hypothetical protein VKK81_05755 [Candidatus Binatia bacterium]|nr:hypothetical protein [Candidatus Binatia bacterium]